MKNIHFIALLLVALFTISLSGCKDDKEDEDVSPKTSLLTEAEWTGEGIYVQGISLVPLLRAAGETEAADQLAVISTAKFKFEKDGTFTATANDLADSGKWRFTDNEQKIVITDTDNVETTFTINKLNATNLDLELNIEDLGLQPIEFQGIPLNTVELRLVR